MDCSLLCSKRLCLIVCILSGSMSGHRLTDKYEHFYAVTKHGITIMTEGLRRELREAKLRIRVTVSHMKESTACLYGDPWLEIVGSFSLSALVLWTLDFMTMLWEKMQRLEEK